VIASEFTVIGGTKVAEFVTSNRPVDVLQGPLGSGKTRALCARVMRHIQEQVKSPIDAYRHSRWAMVRNTMPDLRRTTIRTWLEMFPEGDYGRFVWGAMMQHRGGRLFAKRQSRGRESPGYIAGLPDADRWHGR
jgi:hypothetical protein